MNLEIILLNATGLIIGILINVFMRKFVHILLKKTVLCQEFL